MELEPLATIVILASRNRAKRALYGAIFEGVAALKSAQEAGLPPISIAETMDDAAENARRKALAYRRLAPADWILGEDTSLEIPALDNAPGPAIRRWNGELPDDVSDTAWVAAFRAKLLPLGPAPMPCVKRHHYFFISPQGDEHAFEISLPCFLEMRDLPDHTVFEDGPLSYFLKYKAYPARYEIDLSPREKKELFRPLAQFAQSPLAQRR